MELQSWKRTWRTKLLPVSFQTVLSSINLFSHKFIIAIMPACPNLPSNSVHRIRSPNRETWINWEEYTDRVGIYKEWFKIKHKQVKFGKYLRLSSRKCQDLQVHNEGTTLQHAFRRKQKDWANKKTVGLWDNSPVWLLEEAECYLSSTTRRKHTLG